MSDPGQPHDPQAPPHHEHHVRTPTHELSHEQRLERERFHVTVLSVALLAVLAMLAYSAAFDLDHWAEWIVFGAICFTALGTVVAIKSR
ncbi:MAG TPA: hypothetical protein VFY99_11540 [Solirubrobacterales bacterium]